jgi:hypothetical protein
MAVARGPSTFKQRDLTAALRAARDAGVDVDRFEVAKDGTIKVIVGKPDKKAADTDASWSDLEP